MNKFLSTFTAIFLTVSLPVSVLAQDVITPAMLVHPYDIEIQKKEVEQLITDAVDLSKKVESKERSLDAGQAIFKDYGQYEKLRRMLNGYLVQIEDRDKTIEAKDRQIADLRKQLDEIHKSLNTAVNASSTAPIVVTPIVVPFEKKVDVSINDPRLQEEITRKNQMINDQNDQLAHLRNELADTKNTLIKAQNMPVNTVVKTDDSKEELFKQSEQLTQLKKELAKTKEVLQAANSKYDALLEKSFQNKFNKVTENVTSPIVLQETAKTDKIVAENNAQLEALKNQFDQEIKVKDQEIADLKTQFTKMKDSFERDFAASSGGLAKALGDIANLKVELAKDDTAFATIRERGLALKQKLNAQAKELEQKEIMIKEFKSKLGQTQDDIAGQSNRINTLKQSINDKYALLEIQLKESRTQVDVYAQSIKDLKQQLSAVQNERQTQVDLNVPKVKELREQSAKMKNSFERDLATLSGGLESAQKEQEKIFRESQAKIEELNVIISAKTTRITELENIYNSKIELQVETNQTKIKLLEEQLKELRVTLDERHVSFKSLNQVFTQNKTDLINMQLRLSLYKQLDTLRVKHIVLLNEKTLLLSNKSGRIKNQSGVFIEKISQNISVLNTLKQKSDAQVVILQKEIQQDQEKITDLTKRLVYQEKSSQKEKQDLYRLIERFKSRLKETADVNNDQDKSLALYEAQIDQYQEQQKIVIEEIRVKEEHIAILLKQLADIKMFLADTNSQAKAKDLSLAIVQAMTDEKTKVHQALVAQFKDQVKLIQEQLAQIKEKLFVAEAQLTQVKQDDELARLKDMLKSSREEIIQLNSLLGLKEDQIKGLQNGLDINSKEFEGQNKALEKIKIDLEKQKAAIVKLSDDLLWKNKEVMRLKLQLKDKINIPKIKGDHEQLRNELKDSKEQITTLKEKLTQTQSIVRFLEKKLKHPATVSSDQIK